MNNWKVLRLIVLLALLSVSAWMLYTRGLVGRFGAVSPAAIATDYKTEHECGDSTKRARHRGDGGVRR